MRVALSCARPTLASASLVALIGCGRIGFDVTSDSGGAACARATPVVVQGTWSAGSGSVTSRTMQVSATGTGHLLVVGSTAYCDVANVGDDAPGGGNHYASANVGGSNSDKEYSEIWYAESSVAGATNVTITWSGCSTNNTAQFMELANMDTSSPVEPGGGVSNGDGTVGVAPDVTTTAANSVVFAATQSEYDFTGMQAGNPFTGLGQAPLGVQAAYLIASNVSSYQAVFQSMQSGFYQASAVAFAAACE